jgi:4-diphosphocytidyl-2-C-methyl-D-erythritol kinase
VPGCTGAAIQLTKRIPWAAGLGGGSSDAAATLAGLNDLWKLGLRTPELAALGAELGSDVPFFFQTPAAWCTGRGEQVIAVPLGRPLDLVLVCPDAGLATAEVYREL